MRIVLLFLVLFQFSCGVVNNKKQHLYLDLSDAYLDGKGKYHERFDECLVYPDELLAKKITGKLIYDLKISRKGELIKVNFLHPSYKGFEEEVKRCLDQVKSGWKIKKDKNGRPVPYLVRTSIYFELR